MKKRVLIAITSLDGGGAERVASVWGNMLFDAGLDISYLVCSRVQGEYYINPAIKIYAVAKSNEEYKKIRPLNKYLKYRNAIAESKANIIISFLPKSQIWTMITCIGKEIIRVETLRINPWIAFQSHGKLVDSLWRLCFKTGDRIIVQTEEQKSFFSNRERLKTITIPNPLDDLYLNSKKDSYSEKCTRFVAAGRITQQKNYPLMIKAFAKATQGYTEAILCIYGAGNDDYIQSLNSLINELSANNRIFICGRTPRIAEEYMKSDAFLMSSDYEGMPNSLAEAMAIGLPCISTDCKTGPKDLIDDGINGFLVPVGDEEKYTESILKLLKSNEEERKKIGENARSKVLNTCSKEKSVYKLISLLKEME